MQQRAYTLFLKQKKTETHLLPHYTLTTFVVVSVRLCAGCE